MIISDYPINTTALTFTFPISRDPVKREFKCTFVPRLEDDDTKRFLKDIMYLIARSSRYCYRLSFHEYKHKVSGETLFICFLVIGPVPRHQVAVTRMQMMKWKLSLPDCVTMRRRTYADHEATANTLK